MQEKKVSKFFKVKKLRVVGVIPSFAFQRAKYCALELHRKLPQRFPSPEIVGLLELDWNEKLTEWRQGLGREYWCLRRPVAVFFDDKFIGSDLELIKFTSVGNIVLENVPRADMTFMKDRFRKDYISYLRKAKRIYCYLDICVDGIYVGTLTFQLYTDLLPRTCENFKSLCLGDKGPLLSYRGSRIHRIVKQGWLQGGDIQYKTGGGGFSIFCDPLEDECFAVSHDRRGILSMASGGRHLNASQFFITLSASKWMDTHFVAFGHLVEGARVLSELENLKTFYECPIPKIEIKSCGKLDLGDDEDVDVTYKEHTLPKKKPKLFENVSEQVVRLVMEALTDALAWKEHAPDILDDGDVPSKMNLQLYFQGLYSISDDILEESAQYLRSLRRQLFRTLRTSATEVVEVITYDLLMAVLTRLTTLDDIKETIGLDLYRKMIGGINMEFELCQKPYVRKFVNQIVSTAKSVISCITKKLVKMKIMSTKTKFFQQKMQKWVQSFVLQETFKGDNYHISDRPSWNMAEKRQQPGKSKDRPKREGKPCCDAEKDQKGDVGKLKDKYLPEEICCFGSKLFDPVTVKFSDYFKTCMHDIKRFPRLEEERMPLLDLIEISRFKLRWMRKTETVDRPKELTCVDKKVRKWMEEVVYIPETSWLRDLLYAKDELVFDHVEEILYGAMTAGLLEMYHFYEQYLKLCGGKNQRLVDHVIYPEGYGDSPFDSKEESVEKEIVEEQVLPPCTCGHPCCVCGFDPNYRAPTPPPSLEGEGEIDLESPPATPEPPVKELPPCGPDTELVDLKALIAEKMALKPEEIDIRSFKWLKSYILEKGCDVKTEFATQVHKWIDGDRFNCRGFLSKHSVATRASLLSLSISLAEIIAEENRVKADIRDFIYDLWALYFDEMFKEALLEHPAEESVEESEEGEAERNFDPEAECKKLIAETPDFDFSKFCARFAEETESRPDEEKGECETGEPDKMSQDDAVPDDNTPFMTVDDIEPPKDGADDDGMASLSDEEGHKDVGKKLENADEADESKSQKEAEKDPKKLSPIVVQELIEESSGDESREMPPYVLPFWVKFLTELTKQALGALAKVSRLPRRLYFQTDADLDFDEKMREWFEFNAFNPQPTKGREIMDYIALHHKSIENLEETARSYLRKKQFTNLVNRCTRFSSAEAVADEIVVDVLSTAMKEPADTETVQLYVSDLISTAVASSKRDNEPPQEEDNKRGKNAEEDEDKDDDDDDDDGDGD